MIRPAPVWTETEIPVATMKKMAANSKKQKKKKKIAKDSRCFGFIKKMRS